MRACGRVGGHEKQNPTLASILCYVVRTRIYKSKSRRWLRVPRKHTQSSGDLVPYIKQLIKREAFVSEPVWKDAADLFQAKCKEAGL